MKDNSRKAFYEIMTLCSKDSGEWDISTDSAFLGLTDSQMNFAPSAQIFPQNRIFRQFLC